MHTLEDLIDEFFRQIYRFYTAPNLNEYARTIDPRWVV